MFQNPHTLLDITYLKIIFFHYIVHIILCVSRLYCINQYKTSFLTHFLKFSIKANVHHRAYICDCVFTKLFKKNVLYLLLRTLYRTYCKVTTLREQLIFTYLSEHHYTTYVLDIDLFTQAK